MLLRLDNFMPTRLSGDDRLERSIVRTSKTLSPGFWGGFVFGIAKKVSELDRREGGVVREGGFVF